MDNYTAFAYKMSRTLTLSYSTSFGISSRLFAPSIRKHIYAIYGLVRIADEIVDSYQGENQQDLLDTFEAETYIAISVGYSTNPIIHAFAITAKQYKIPKKDIAAFFKSMQLDLVPHTYDKALYDTYIYGSAEVIGLMCLRVFCGHDENLYTSLEPGARALGSAYQKVNFLRDFAHDYEQLHRIYFPGVTFENFNDKTKTRIVKDIRRDIATAQTSLNQLPKSSRVAVWTSLAYYTKLLDLLERAPADTIKRKRIRVHDAHKFMLLTVTTLKQGIKQ